MSRLHRTVLSAAIILLALGHAPFSVAGDMPGSENDLDRVIAMIDGRIAEKWQSQQTEPTHPATDAEFLRRVSLDITGRIPTVMEVREFLADDSPDKRRRAVDRLLEDPRYAIHFTHFWRGVLLPEVETDFNVSYMAPGFDGWLRTKLLENASYQKMVQELLSVDVSNIYNYGVTQPIAFYAAKELKPENLGAATSRMFLGVRIECAQCHDHPFDSWTRRDFWGYSAFFAGLERQRPSGAGLLDSLREFFGQKKIQIPETDIFVEPTYLGGVAMSKGVDLSPRQAVTSWITSDDNPYFARMGVNRMWGHFFGEGIVEPVDDFSERNPPSHPELLEELAQEFKARQYDLKFLIRAIVLSRAYQLSSEQTDSRQQESRLFARMAVKGLSSEQIYDNLALASGKFEPFRIESFAFNAPTSPRGRIQELFTDLGTSPLDRPTTILQALALMNGELVSNASRPAEGKVLGSTLEFPGFEASDRIEVLYLAALSRMPTEEERQAVAAYLQRRPTDSQQEALGDVYWALLNSSEFLYNH